MTYNYDDLLEALEDVVKELGLSPRNQIQTLIDRLEEELEDEDEE